MNIKYLKKLIAEEIIRLNEAIPISCCGDGEWSTVKDDIKNFIILVTKFDNNLNAMQKCYEENKPVDLKFFNETTDYFRKANNSIYKSPDTHKAGTSENKMPSELKDIYTDAFFYMYKIKYGMFGKLCSLIKLAKENNNNSLKDFDIELSSDDKKNRVIGFRYNNGDVFSSFHFAESVQNVEEYITKVDPKLTDAIAKPGDSFVFSKVNPDGTYEKRNIIGTKQYDSFSASKNTKDLAVDYQSLIPKLLEWVNNLPSLIQDWDNRQTAKRRKDDLKKFDKVIKPYILKCVEKKKMKLPFYGNKDIKDITMDEADAFPVIFTKTVGQKTLYTVCKSACDITNLINNMWFDNVTIEDNTIYLTDFDDNPNAKDPVYVGKDRTVLTESRRTKNNILLEKIVKRVVKNIINEMFYY